MDLARKSLLLAALFILLGSVWLMDTSRAYLKTKGEFHIVHKVVVASVSGGETDVPLARTGQAWQIVARHIASSGKAPYTIVRDPKTGAETARFKTAGQPSPFRVIITYRVMIDSLPTEKWEAGRLIFGPDADWVPPSGVSEIASYSAS